MQKIIRFLGTFFIIAAVIIGFYLFSEKLRFNAIVIHHSASAADNYHSIAEYQHREHGWRDAGYHLILANSSTNVPLGYLEATGRYRFLAISAATKNVYYNVHAIHLCVVGDYDKHEMPEALRVALVDALRQLQEKYGIADDQILFHRDCSSSSCPGRLISKEKLHQWLTSVSSKCPLAIKRQHEKVIGGEGGLFYAVERKVDRLSARALGV